MNEETRNEVIEEGNTEVAEVKETKEGIGSKAKSWIKRNGKKIGKGILITAGLGLAYVLGRNSSTVSENDADDDTNTDIDAVDVEFTETEGE